MKHIYLFLIFCIFGLVLNINVTLVQSTFTSVVG